MVKKINTQRGGALIEAALSLSMLAVVFFGGVQVVRQVSLKNRLTNILNTWGQLIGQSSAAIEGSHICKDPSWDDDDYCKVLHSILEDLALPSCAVIGTVTPYAPPEGAVLEGTLADLVDNNSAFPDWTSGMTATAPSLDSLPSNKFFSLEIKFNSKDCPRPHDSKISAASKGTFPLYGTAS
jgi:hypothetical protein